MNDRSLPFLDHAATLADLTRCRILSLLSGHELTVSELSLALQLPQSTASRHLKVLSDGGWIEGRREGTSHFYRLDLERLEAPARQLWDLVRDQMVDTDLEVQDRARLDSVLAERRSRSQAFFSTTAGRWDHLRDELFGQRFDLMALAGLLDPSWRVGDLACGTGRIAEALAPFVARVEAVDDSSAMLDAARRRLGRFDNVTVRRGTLEDLPIPERSLDAATLVLALHHVAEPRRVLSEVRRVLAPGGRLLLVDMVSHDRESFRNEMGHLWLGFAESDIEAYLAASGLELRRHQLLPPDAAARGPNLFVATAAVTRAVDPDPSESMPTANEEIPS